MTFWQLSRVLIHDAKIIFVTHILNLALLGPGIMDWFTSLRNSLQMQLNQTYVPEEGSVELNKHMEQRHYKQVVLHNCSTISDCPAALESLPQRDSVEEFQQETEQTMTYRYSKSHRCSGMPLTDRRERNRERERKRQTRLKGAFNVLRSVIPDYFSEREPGDRLSRIQTLRLAKKYIATFHELLETC